MSVIEIFRAGRHRTMSGVDREFTERDLDLVSATYSPTCHEAPLVLGHPQTDSPAYGWVRRVFRNGSSLFAEVGQASEALKQWVKEGRYKKISASFYTPESSTNPVPGAYYLKHVGFLGATAPAVKGMADPVFSEFGEGHVCFGASENDLAACFNEVSEERIGRPPRGYVFDPSRMLMHLRILALQQACPDLSYAEAAVKLRA